jgi:hypothetical protein
MARASGSDPLNPDEAKLPGRDWIVLPALALLTICVLVVSADLIARRLFATLPGAGEDCIVFNDPVTGSRGIPNSVCREKIAEGEVTEYRFNNCGFRTDLHCGTKSAGAYRIVMIGASFAMGMRVPNEETFATLLPLELSRRTGRNIELYNEGMPWRPPQVIARHFREVLAAKPDIILWTIDPADIWDAPFPVPPPGPPKVPQPYSTLTPYRKVRRFLGGALLRVNMELAGISKRGSTLFRHFLYESQSRLIASYLAEKPDAPLMQRIHGPEFMKTAPGAEWQSRLRIFDGYAADIAAQARAAGVPLVAVLMPQRAQVAMISMGSWPSGFDPYKLDNELRSMVVSHGGTYIDILPGFRDIPNPEQGFFPLDVHPNARGHAMISGLLGREMTRPGVPVLGLAAPQTAGLDQGR